VRAQWGRWISDAILCEPVPPPPPGLEIEPLGVGEDGTVREALERHRNNPSCASCHALLDITLNSSGISITIVMAILLRVA